MARGIGSRVCLIALILLMYHSKVRGTRDILTERCEDQYGASLNENFALNKAATQSSTSNNGDASRLVDGNRNPYFGNNSCSETTFDDPLSWEVDLETVVYVTSVTITTRADDYWLEKNNFFINVLDISGDRLCATGFVVHDGETTTYACENVGKSNRVRITVPGTNRKLSLCEVEVHGHPSDFYDNEVNYALGQPSKQSTTLHSHNSAPEAVDGIRNTGYGFGSCTHTTQYGGDWWSVDLGILVDVYAIAITNRGDAVASRLENFAIRIGRNWHPSKNPSCAEHPNIATGETRAIFCLRPMRGSYVGIIQRMKNTLFFCEVSVHGREVSSITAKEPVCFAPKPLGMENHTILASQLKASSRANALTDASYSRLNSLNIPNVAGGAWHAHGTNDQQPWIQVAFLWLAAVTEIQTQGRNGVAQWVTSFQFSSSNDFVRYESYFVYGSSGVKDFPGNSDSDTVVSHRLQPVRVVRIVRISVLTYQSAPCLRVEFVGCYYKDTAFPLPQALGMQSQAISDSLIDSSTVYGPSFVPKLARLMGRVAWIPVSLADDPDAWIQINFVLTVTIVEILTQGRSKVNQWTKNYKVRFAQDPNIFRFYKENGKEKLFRGNTDSDTVVANALSPAIRAQYIRIYPRDYRDYRAMRLEFIGYYEDQETGPLGLEDGRIQDVQLSASSVYGNRSPNLARLHGNFGWIPATASAADWLQVDFLRLTKVTEIRTQGYANHDHWSKSFKVLYSMDTTDFTSYMPYGLPVILNANTDRHSVARNPILPAIEARVLRILRDVSHGYPGLRIEVFGYYITCAASCNARPLGMESREISDTQITASSTSGINFLAGGARLNFVNEGNPRKGWRALQTDSNAWLQVAFDQIADIVEVQTQPRSGADLFSQYTLSYGNNGVDFKLYTQDDMIKVFSGSGDPETTDRHSLWPYITARFIRINAVSCPGVCAIKAEFIGAYQGVHGPELIDPEYVAFENTLYATSSKDWNHQPQDGIISRHFEPRAWSPLKKERGQYIQIDLLQLSTIAGVGFRLAGDRIADHYTKLVLLYGDTADSLKFSTDNAGNMTLFDTRDCYKALEKRILARFVRFSIDSWITRPDFRFQLYETTEYSEAGAGIETGSIKDHQMKSSNHPNDPFPAHEGRLNAPRAWCGNPSRRKLYLQLDFLWDFEVHAVSSQGKTVGIMMYVTKYKLSSSLDGINWNVYKEEQIDKIFTGNTNCRCIRKNPVQPFLTRAVRFLPTTWKNAPCMRVEVFGVYKGVLRIYARSGVLKGPEEAIVTRKCSIKLNGEEVSRQLPGYNVAVVNPTTGALNSSRSAEKASELNDLLMGIPDDSVVVIATQNVTQRPPDETLHLLESLGAIGLRYSMDSDNLMFLLVGYKGKKRVKWIKEKLGTAKDDDIRIAVPITLNEKEMKSEIDELFVSANTNVTDDAISLSGNDEYIFRNITGRCGDNNTNCEMGFSLAMWMKQEPIDYLENVESPPTSERIDLQYYSQGYNYIVIRDKKTWNKAQRYCLGVGGTLPVYHNKQTMDYLRDLVKRLGLGWFWLGMTIHPHGGFFSEWIDGSPAVITKWNLHEPSGLPEACVYDQFSGFNDVHCDNAKLTVICQQPIEDLLGADVIIPLGMETTLISDASITVSSYYNSATSGGHGRLNKNSWCIALADVNPYIQVDLGKPTRICAVATQGRGVDLARVKYPEVFCVEMTNNSVDWTPLQHHDQIKYFRGNYDNNGVVINRFPQSEIARIIRINILKYFGGHLCMRIELFGCSTGYLEKQSVDSILPPKSIADDTPRSCVDVLMRGKTSDGVYMIDPDGRGAFPAFCDQSTDGGGWTVFQNRFDGSVDFNRIWDEYKWGFGDSYGEHWLGLEYMSRITQAPAVSLRVDLKKFSGSDLTNYFYGFLVSDEASGYTMSYKTRDGAGSDSLHFHRNVRFETKDKYGGKKYPTIFKGAWWYGNSHVFSNLNAIYYPTEYDGYSGMFWYKWNGHRSCETTRMMIRQAFSDRGPVIGLENLSIQNYQMTSSFPDPSRPPANGRLNFANFWSGSQVPGQFLSINFISPRRITHISTQGGSDFRYVASFSVRFKKLDGTIADYEENGEKRIFEGNNIASATNADAIVSNCFKEPVEATQIWIYPLSCSLERCSLRMELYACENSGYAPIGVQSSLPVDKLFSSESTSSMEDLRLFTSTQPWLSTPANPVDGRYVEVKLPELFRVTAIAINGGQISTLKCHVTEYYLMYLNEQMKWVNYGGRKPKIFPGNPNYRVQVNNKLEAPFLAHAVRLVRHTHVGELCLKMEIYGCYPDNPSIVLHNETLVPGEHSKITGRYRYCPDYDMCPGCIKSICLRLFDKKYPMAEYFAHDCIYHDFDIEVKASTTPGRHRVYLIESEYANCHTNKAVNEERIVGSIYIKKEPSNCLELLLAGKTESGKYFIDPDGKGSFEVYCDQSLYGGGWTVFQTRETNSPNFDETWYKFKVGFGDLEADFWLGNKLIHRLTAQRQELSLELQANTNDDVAFVLYKSFQVSSEEDGYRLHVAEYQPGSPAGDCLLLYDGVKFSTKDKNHDDRNCYMGMGWWFKACSTCRLNGLNSSTNNAERMKYGTWTNKAFLTRAKMKVRDRETVFCNDHYCYYLLKTWKNWFEASAECRRFNSDLVSIRDATENEWIRREILNKLSVEKVHIGLKNTTWLGGGSFQFHNFSSNEQSELCSVLSSDGSWRHHDCGLKARILCKRGKWCFRNRCHVHTTDNLVDIYKNVKYCEDIGYKLSKIRNEEEIEYHRMIYQASTHDSSWRDVYFSLTLDSLRRPHWHDGKRVRSTFWKGNEPDDVNKKCGKFWKHGWADANCGWPGNAICEKVYEEHPLDCLDLLLSGGTTSGIYTVDPDGMDPIKVYCDQETFGGGWTVLLRRIDSSLDFTDKVWDDYKNGFGALGNNFWLGNDYNHRLTKLKQEVLFDLESESGDNGFALYKTFQIADEENLYKLTIEDYQTSNIGDAMAQNNLMAFSTSDRDNDKRPNINCALKRLSGWWFNSCTQVLLTGQYLFNDADKMISWRTWTSNNGIKAVDMKIRSSSAVICNDKFCYYLTYTKKTWSEALQECRNFNADLLSIHSEDENTLISGFIQPQAIESVHLGLISSDSWSDGSPATFRKLTSLPSASCSSLEPNVNDWQVNDCDEAKRVVCKRGKHCYKGDCYFFTPLSTAPQVWTSCKTYGCEPVKVSSRDEKEYLLKLVRESTADGSSPYLFNGLVYQTSDEDRVWPDGTMLKYNDWVPPEPNGVPNEIYTTFVGDGFYDTPTSNTNPSFCEKAPIIKSCNEIKQKYDRSDSGVYAYNGKDSRTFPVHCEVGSKDGPWLVFQRRVEGESPADFATQSWTSFKNGFGTKESNFWLGNKYIHEITWNNPHRLKIVIYSSDFNVYEAIYEDFYLGSEQSGYVINFGAFSGNAGDALSKHRGMQFSATGDDRSASSCTTSHPGGWWFENCLDSNLNGVFTAPSNAEGQIFWRTIKDNILKTEMKIQPYYTKGSRVLQTAQGQATSLSLTSKQDWMEVKLQTPSQQWVAHVLHPGPFLTHVSITWEESAYLRYYENGRMVAEVPALPRERPGYKYTSLSVFVDLPFSWLQRMKLWNEKMSSSDADNEYGKTEITFDDDAGSGGNINITSNYTWVFRRTCTPSNKTGACGDHTYHRNTGTFISTEGSRPAYPGDVAIVESPIFSDHYKCLSFWYHLYGQGMGKLSVYAKTNSQQRKFLAEIKGDIGNEWRLMQVDLEITEVFKIIIEATRGEGYQSDAAIDDISLTRETCKKECDPPCGPGKKCDTASLQCVYDGIYDHLWSMDSWKELKDDKEAFKSVVSSRFEIPGVVYNAVSYGLGELAAFNDKCLMDICFPKYTLSFWFKYDAPLNTGKDYLLSFGDYFGVFHQATAPKDHLGVSTFVGLTKCEFQIFAPAKIWNHLIFVVGDDRNDSFHNFTIYRNGEEVTNFTLDCNENEAGPGYPSLKLGLGKNAARHFAIDDLRLLFDALSVDETLENYRIITGHNQSIWFQVNLTTIPWQEELSDDESDLFRTTCQYISDKVMATLSKRSDLNSVHVRKFSQGSTLAEVEVLYNKVSYYDILSLEEAIIVNKTCNGLEMNCMGINSTSVPNIPPQNMTAVAVNTTAILVSWSLLPSSYMNGVFQGYKVLYRETDVENSYAEYQSTTIYANNSKELLQGLAMTTNYTLRILAFTLSGDGFPSDPVIVTTFDGEVTDSPNMTVTNVSSTVLFVNWTMLPNSTVDYRYLFGYELFYWKDAEEPEVFNMTFLANTSQMLFENLEKWTVYCFTIAGVNSAGPGPNETQCARTFEDVPEQPPFNVSAEEVTTSKIRLKWFPPPKSAVPGVLRYYNISYRVLNISDGEVVEVSLPATTTTHLIDGLTGLLLCEINVTACTIDVGPVQTIRVITEEGVPLAAPNITLVNTSSTSIVMNWTALPWKFHNGILLGYNIWLLKGETGGNFIQTKQRFSFNELYKHLTNMSKWTNYCVRIAGYTAVGDGVQSATPECTRTFEDAPEEPPSNFIAQDVSVTSIEVMWGPPPVASVPGIIRSYNFTYRNLNYTRENLTARQIGANDRTFTLEHLHGLTLYEINITAITILPGPWKTIHVLTEEGVPAFPPVNILWRNLSSTSLNVTWEPPPPHLCNGIITGYNVFLWKRSDPGNVMNYNLSASEQVKLWDGLEKWTFYCGQIVAFTRIGKGPRSPVECIRTFEDEPEVSPPAMNGTNVTWTSVYLSWDAINPAFIPGVLRSYRVTYKVLDPEYEQFNHAYDGSILVDSQATSVNLTGLIGLTNYNITVNGLTVKDGPIIQVNIKTVEAVPTSPPEEVTPTAVTPRTVSLSWKEIFLPGRHGIIKGYEVTYKKLEDRSKREADKTLTFGADVHTAFLFKLVPYTNYSFTVAGYTSQGMGAKKYFIIETKEGVPNVAPKSSYSVNFTGPTTIFVGWGSLSKSELEGRLAGYEVRYRKFSVADEILEYPPPAMVKVVYSDINGIKLTGLETYTTYQVQIAAMSGGGRGVWSDVLYVATCRCHKILTTNFWNIAPYTNISVHNTYHGFIPYLLDMVTFSCCQNCLEHGTSEVDYFHDGQGNAPERDSDISVKTSLTLNTDYSFPVYGYEGQTTYMKYYGYATIIEIVGSVFLTLKPDYSLTQGGVLFDAVLTIVPFLAISVIFAYIAGVIQWALECRDNEDEYAPKFFTGAASGFWWAYVTMTTVGYGDKTARTKAGRVFAVVWVLISLCICSLLIGTITSAFTTSTTPPESKDIMIYGSTIAALQDSPDHKLGLRRNAKVNADNKTYTSLNELRKVLLSGVVDGILIDAYVADSRKDLFSSSNFLVKKVIDISSSYGVVMGTDAKKLRKCFNKFWKENSAVRSEFISNNSRPVKVTEVSTADMVAEAYNPQTALYQITLYTCAISLIVLSLCGCVYEIIRRKRISMKVDCEKESAAICSDLRSETAVLSDKIHKNIADLLKKQRNELLAFVKSQRVEEQKGNDEEETP